MLLCKYIAGGSKGGGKRFRLDKKKGGGGQKSSAGKRGAKKVSNDFEGIKQILMPQITNFPPPNHTIYERSLTSDPTA